MTTKRCLVTAALVVCAMAIGVGQARAATISRTGTPGSATLPYTDARVNFLDFPNLIFNARTAYRSPASSGTQYIDATMRVWHWDRGAGRWVYDSALSHYAGQYVTAGHALTFNTWSTPGLDITKEWSVDVKIRWYTSGGTLLGTTTQDYNQVGDYRALTTGISIGRTPDGGAGVVFAD